ncbi:YciI family protein [Actinoplanes sp. NPDC049316]|uniref:YciI family protein n=1 Tax=Actinoplanes sp. NPDC049316 TaxID=3154727 RepID=UPI003422086C
MISTYLAPLDEVDKARDDHLAFVAGLEEQGLVVSAGRQEPPVGGVILFDVDSEQEARDLIAQDPYVQRGLAEYAATGWKPTRGVLATWKRPA